MAGNVISIIGSGQQPHRKVSHGKKHNIADMVFVVNHEDQIAAYDMYTSGFALPAGSSGVRMPPRTASEPNYPGRREIRIWNNGPGAIWVANNSGVKTPQASNGGISIGYPVPASGSITLNIAATIDVYAAGTSGAQIFTMEIA